MMAPAMGLPASTCTMSGGGAAGVGTDAACAASSPAHEAVAAPPEPTPVAGAAGVADSTGAAVPAAGIAGAAAGATPAAGAMSSAAGAAIVVEGGERRGGGKWPQRGGN